MLITVFVTYNDQIFSWADQVRLAEHVRDLVQRGCHVVVCNADDPSVRALNEGFTVKTIERFPRIAAAIVPRKAITEGLFFNSDGSNAR